LGMDPQVVLDLPEEIGVYYLLDRAGKVLYVGKSTNIKQRIITHFSDDLESSKTQHWLRDVAHIKTRLCGHELAALVWEDMEINHLWPKFNKAQKVNRMAIGLFKYVDRQGNTRLKVEKSSKGQAPLFRFASHPEATAWLRQQIDAYNLYPEFCGMFEIEQADIALHEAGIAALEADLRNQHEGFVVLLDGPDPSTQIFLWLVGGNFYAIGALPRSEKLEARTLSAHIWRKGTSYYCDRIIWQYLAAHPDTPKMLVNLTDDVFLGTNGLHLFS
jgi:predicted GIY-YIG superfamily endonuclease